MPIFVKLGEVLAEARVSQSTAKAINGSLLTTDKRVIFKIQHCDRNIPRVYRH